MHGARACTEVCRQTCSRSHKDSLATHLGGRVDIPIPSQQATILLVRRSPNRRKRKNNIKNAVENAKNWCYIVWHLKAKQEGIFHSPAATICSTNLCPEYFASLVVQNPEIEKENVFFDLHLFFPSSFFTIVYRSNQLSNLNAVQAPCSLLNLIQTYLVTCRRAISYKSPPLGQRAGEN